MHEIPKIDNKINAIYIYLESNKDDHEADMWYNLYNHEIVNHINKFSKADCEKLVSEIWSWEDDKLFHLADPFLDISNPNLDGYFLYCKIFLEINDIENEEYLLGNIHLVNAIKKQSQPISFYIDLENKIKRVNEKLNGNYKYSVDQIKLKINTENSNCP